MSCGCASGTSRLPISRYAALFGFLARPRDRFQALPRSRRELLLFGICLLTGVLVVPGLIWVIGDAVLGEYAGGGPLALLGDFFAGLAQGSLVYWAVALGPYVFLCLGRLLLYWLRSTGARAQSANPRTASRTG